MEQDLRLKTPARILISGGSCCGKTSLIEKLLINHRNCFDKPFEEICWSYAEHADDKALFHRLKNQLDIPVQFHKGFPEEEILKNNLFSKPRGAHKCLVLDDLFCQPKTSKSLLDIFSVLSHHQNITCILVCQNLSGNTPSQKACLSTLLRSASYLVVFSSRRSIPVVQYIGKTFYPGESHKVLHPFKYLLNTKEPHKYLVFDFTTEDSLLQVREGGLTPGETCYGFQHEADTADSRDTQKSQSGKANSVSTNT